MVTRLRGRDTETAQLTALLDRLATGQGATALVLGEAGAGKSRLMDEVVVAAGARQQLPIRINADEIDLMSPLSTLLRGLVQAESLPGAEALRRDVTAARSADIWLVHEIQSMLERAAARHPLVIVVDDVDRADDLSLHTVRLLSDSMESSAVGWFLTTRTEPPPRLTRLRASIARHDGLILTLGPLADADAVGIVEDLAGGPVPPSLRTLALGAGGNPLLLTELAGGYRAGDPEIPLRVREAIRARVTAVPAASVDVLEVAAVLGRTFRIEDLCGVMRQTPAAVLRALRPLLSEGIVNERKDQLVFRHDLLREAVLAELPAEATRLVHRDVASLLLRRGELPVDVANHLLAGAGPGDVELAGPVATASERLMIASPARAAELARKALQISAGQPAHWLEIAARATLALTTAGELDEALALLALASSRGLDADAEAGNRAALADALWRQGRMTDADAVIGPALERSDVSGPARLRVEIAWARTRTLSGQADRAIGQLESAAAQARRLGDRDATSSALASRSMALRFMGRLDESIDAAREAVAVRPGDSPRADPRIWLARSLTAADRLGEADLLCRELLRDSTSPAGARDLPLVSSTSARLLLAHGRVADALTESTAGIAAMEAQGSRELAAELYACAALATWFAAGRDAALAALDRPDRLAAGHPYTMHHMEFVRVLVEDGGDPATIKRLAAPLVERLTDGFGQLVFDPMHGPALVRCLVGANLREEAEVVVRRCGDLAALNPGIGSWRAAADQAAGLRAGDEAMLLGAADRFEKCGRQLAAALAGFDAIAQSRRSRPRERARVAAALRVTGAQAIADRLGAGPAKPSRKPVSGWASLTPAELRVAELAAVGATNKEIAEHLWISPYTVDTHMRHTLAKLGLRSRVALARAAAQQGSRTGIAPAR
jgi:DNA-binding CsgD family transcriptional regulator/tetratricopeptide (TPR) repeat protein